MFHSMSARDISIVLWSSKWQEWNWLVLYLFFNFFNRIFNRVGIFPLKFMKNTYIHQTNFQSVQYFQKYKHFFFIAKLVGQIRNINNRSSLYCSLPCFPIFLCTHFRSLECYSTYFRKWIEIGVLRPKFQDYVVSCDYA